RDASARDPRPDAKGARAGGQKGPVSGFSGADGSASPDAGFSGPPGSSATGVVGATTVGPGGAANRYVPAGCPQACSAAVVARGRSSRPPPRPRLRASRASPSAAATGSAATGASGAGDAD